MALMFVSLLTRLPSLLRLVLSWFKAA